MRIRAITTNSVEGAISVEEWKRLRSEIFAVPTSFPSDEPYHLAPPQSDEPQITLNYYPEI